MWSLANTAQYNDKINSFYAYRFRLYKIKKSLNLKNNKFKKKIKHDFFGNIIN